MVAQSAFHKVAIMGRPTLSDIEQVIQHLVDYLHTQNRHIVIEQDTASSLKTLHWPVVPASELSNHCELIIVIGGDGSLLSAGRIAAEQGLPVLGINRGSLGFLTDINPDELHVIGSVLEGQYWKETRFLLEGHIQNGEAHHCTALNDIVLLPGEAVHLIEFDVHINNSFMCSYKADGLITATPTGSTAYALSMGGPILPPDLDALVLVPIAPHKLSSRPIAINAQHTLHITITENNPSPPCLSADGQQRISTPAGSKITIQRYQKPLLLTHPLNYNYYETLRAKLRWEE